MTWGGAMAASGHAVRGFDGTRLGWGSRLVAAGEGLEWRGGAAWIFRIGPPGTARQPWYHMTSRGPEGSRAPG